MKCVPLNLSIPVQKSLPLSKFVLLDRSRSKILSFSKSEIVFGVHKDEPVFLQKYNASLNDNDFAQKGL